MEGAVGQGCMAPVPTMRRMSLTAARLPVLHRCAPGVLAAWLCVLLVSGLAPWWTGTATSRWVAQVLAAPAPVLERLCSHSDTPQWVPSPFPERQVSHTAGHGAASAGSGLHGIAHTLDCALCLPLMAFGGLEAGIRHAPAPCGHLAQWSASPCTARAAVLPPARAPPATITLFV